MSMYICKVIKRVEEGKKGEEGSTYNDIKRERERKKKRVLLGSFFFFFTLPYHKDRHFLFCYMKRNKESLLLSFFLALIGGSIP